MVSNEKPFSHLLNKDDNNTDYNPSSAIPKFFKAMKNKCFFKVQLVSKFNLYGMN